MRIPTLREVYDAVEKQVTPRANALSHTDQAAQVSAAILQTRRAVSRRVDRLSARILHLANLPAGTDITRVRRQLGDLDREVRRLRMELARARGEEVQPDAEHRPPRGDRPSPS